LAAHTAIFSIILGQSGFVGNARAYAGGGPTISMPSQDSAGFKLCPNAMASALPAA